jgi:hypothetical protein
MIVAVERQLVSDPIYDAATRTGRLEAIVDACHRMHVRALRDWNALRERGPALPTYHAERAHRHALLEAEREAVARHLAVIDARLALEQALTTRNWEG